METVVVAANYSRMSAQTELTTMLLFLFSSKRRKEAADLEIEYRTDTWVPSNIMVISLVVMPDFLSKMLKMRNAGYNFIPSYELMRSNSPMWKLFLSPASCSST